MNDAALPLKNLRVLDLAHLFPGEFATMWLGALGAEVIKVESPVVTPPIAESELLRDQLNRGKRSIVLDLKTTVGQKRLHQLAATADVLVEGFRPGVAARLCVDYPTLSALNPRLIYCSISGFGQDGALANHPAHDLNYVALTGILANNFNHGDAATRVPHPLPIQLADLGGGAMPAVVNILAALHARSQTGKGQYLDVAMLDNALTWAFLLLNTSSTLLLGTAPSYYLYETADGRYLAVGALEEKFWQYLCEKINRPDLLPVRLAPEDNLTELRALFRTRSLGEWLTVLDPEQTCIAPVLTSAEVEQHPQIKHRGVLRREGDKLYVALPSRFAGQPLFALTSTPQRGEHTAEILRELDSLN